MSAPRLRLAEAITLLSGRDYWHTEPLPRLKLPSLTLTDGPHGVRLQPGETKTADLQRAYPSTCYPSASALACSWDPALLQQVGRQLGREARALGVDMLLGPGLNIKRSPLCGRNFEYFSEDPLLSGEMAAGWVAGVQAEGVGACLKHFAANSQETRRMSVNSVVDARAAREVYLRGFEIAVKRSAPWGVMTAYNGLNGRYCSESPWLLTQVLRREWGFKGLVISDWGAVQNRASAFAAGIDLEMPGLPGLTEGAVYEALQAGYLRRQDVMRAAEAVVQLAERCKRRGVPDPFSPQAAHDIARQAAEKGAVLLQNCGNLLPLSRGLRLTVIGAFAEIPRYQGAGSSHLNPRELETPLAELQREFGAENITYAPGYGRQPSDPGAAEPLPELLQEAQAAARAADVAIIFVGLPEASEAEGVDREHLQLPASHNALVEAVLAVNDRVAVVIQAGAPAELPWRGRVAAILCTYLGGQAGGSAVARLLAGAANPCGKLAETWPAHLADVPCSAFYPGGLRSAEYRESLLAGYRYFGRVGAQPAYPFGHGLSYTRFELSGLCLPELNAAGGGTLSVTVKNTGARAGAEVVQVYAHRRQETSAVLRPGPALAAFARIELAPGQSQRLTLTLPRRTFEHYDPFWGSWRTEEGPWEILVGTSSEDIRLRAELQINGEPICAPPLPSAYQQPGFPLQLSQADFSALLGQTLPPNCPWEPGHFTPNTPLDALQGTLVGRALLGAMVYVQRQQGQASEGGASLGSERVLRQLPLHTVTMQPGPTSNAAVPELLAALSNADMGGALQALKQALKLQRAARATKKEAAGPVN